MFSKILGMIILGCVLVFTGIIYTLSQKYPTTSPLLIGQYYIESLILPHKKLDKHVLGFMPYWRVDDLTNVRPQLLSEFNYFSLSVGFDGHILKVSDGETDPGWRAWQSQELKDFGTRANILGTDMAVTIAVLDNTLITEILDSDQAQQNLIEDIMTEVKTRNLQGVNIDFEYFGEPDPVYRDAFTKFSKQLSATLDKEVPGTKLSISIMPLAAREDDLFNFQEIVPVYDRFIGMSYDYYGSSSDISGPVAPMNGFAEGKYFFDVTTTYNDYRKVIPQEKIVMGVPYYGWERAVLEAKTEKSLTYASDNENNYAAVISYARAREADEIKKNQCTWDKVAQETWCWFQDKDSGTDRQVWIADNRSVETRFNYANQQNLGGIAIWTLGYDKQYSDLWDMISNKFTDQ